MSNKHDIFISYRRTGGGLSAKIIRDKLKEMGYDVFFDVDSLKSGNFNERLFSIIDDCKDFLIVLSPGALDRCVNPDGTPNDNDWVKKELAHALKAGKNVVPIMLNGFEMPKPGSEEANLLPEDIRDICVMNGMTSDPTDFDQKMKHLTDNLLISKPNFAATFKFVLLKILLPIAAIILLIIIIAAVFRLEKDVKDISNNNTPVTTAATSKKKTTTAAPIEDEPEEELASLLIFSSEFTDATYGEYGWWVPMIGTWEERLEENRFTDFISALKTEGSRVKVTLSLAKRFFRSADNPTFSVAVQRFDDYSIFEIIDSDDVEMSNDGVVYYIDGKDICNVANDLDPSGENLQLVASFGQPTDAGTKQTCNINIEVYVPSFSATAEYKTISYDNGDEYAGDVVGSIKNGQGTMTYSDGSVYSGTWVNDTRRGDGKMTYTNGDTYEGSWKNDQPDGKGTYTWAAGHVYEGTWANGVRDGDGFYLKNDGTIYRLTYKNGEVTSETLITAEEYKAEKNN